MRLKFSFLVVLLAVGLTSVWAKDKKSYPSLLTEFVYSADIEEKAKQGDSDALWMLGLHNMPDKERKVLGQVVMLNDKGFAKQPNQESAIKLIEKSAKKGNPIAMILMGRYEYVSLGNKELVQQYKQAEKCEKEAVKWYEKAMKCGYGDACALIYDIKSRYPNYKRVLYDERRAALEYLDNGISMRSPLSAQYLGLSYLQEPFDFKKAFDCFSLIEEWGLYSPKLTALYMEGKGCQRNYAEAIKRVEAHPQYSHTSTTYAKMAECFASGKGVKQDKEKADYYLVKCTSQLQAQSLSLSDASLLLFKGISLEEWMTQPTAENYEYTPTVFEEDSITRFSDTMYLLKRGGVYFVVNEKGDYLTHSLDTARIEGDSIVIMFDKYKSTIGHDGNMRNPIVSQMLVDWMQAEKLSGEKVILENWICSLDADGAYGIACILQNNKGVEAEDAFSPVNYVLKNGYSINKNVAGQMMTDAVNKGQQNVHYSRALPFYERAAELNPDFEQAQINVDRMRKALVNLKDSETSPFMIGMSSVLQLANNFVQIRSPQHTSLPKESNVRQGGNPKKIKPKTGAVVSAQNEMLDRRTYHDYVSLLIDMSTFRDRYDDNQRKKIQRSMRLLREKRGFPKSEWEDWNGK